MGHDISPIGNHKLKTTDVYKLAQDITSRIDINIEYGYFGQKEYFKLLGRNKDDGLVYINKIVKHKDFKTFYLVDESFQLKELYNKFGDELLYKPDYWRYNENKIPDEQLILKSKKELELEIKHPSYSLDFENNTGSKNFIIYKENFGITIPYYTRWFGFCHFFTEKYYKEKEYFNKLNNFRKEIMDYTFKWGGDKIYYLDDQNYFLEGVGQGGEWDMSWVDFEKFVIKKTSHLMLDIPKFFADKNYRIEFHKHNDYPLSFIDNFEDIKN